jgi:hypothetical protein
MRPLSAAELLDAWERGLSEPVPGRGLALLAAACPDVSSDALAALSIGECDSRLLTLREWSFGSQLASVSDCSRCGERLEWTTSIRDLRSLEQPASSGELSLTVGGYAISFRLPNTLDFAAAAECADPAAARLKILERSVIAARRGDQAIAPGDLPVAVVEAIEKRMAEVDSQANIQLDLLCPACGHRWQALFDIGSFFWGELNAWAQRLLAEVHVLASAYGWREADILNLSPARRQFYLGLISG